jgi:acyl-CoA synthetase (AMP-forming)/AMP-acid ligase II
MIRRENGQATRLKSLGHYAINSAARINAFITSTHTNMARALSEWLVAAVGIFWCGATLLPIVATYGAKELSFILRQSHAKLLITPEIVIAVEALPRNATGKVLKHELRPRRADHMHTKRSMLA